MATALQVLNVALMDLLSVERKMLALGMVQYSPLFFILVRFYGMLQLRAKGKVLDWDWQDWLEEIDDDLLRLKLRVALEKDEALQSGGLPVLTSQHRPRRRLRRRNEANRAS